MCAKNYTCKRNQQENIERQNISLKKKKSSTNDTKITMEHDSDVCFVPDAKKHVTFLNDATSLPIPSSFDLNSSTLQHPPSFNLHPFQISTPKQPYNKLTTLSSPALQLPTSLNLNSQSNPLLTTTSTQTQANENVSKIHVPQLHAIDKIDKLDEIVFDIEQKDDISHSQAKSCQIS